MRFEIQAECPVTGARAGLLHTDHGTVETPVFMPVGTQATVKGVLQRDLANELDAKIILANTYHLFLRPGHELIRQLGGSAPLHVLADRAILTDSGGFQVFSLSNLERSRMRASCSGPTSTAIAHLFTPESTVDVQLAFGSDIMMVLDECLAYPASHEAAKAAMRRTVQWARRGARALREDDRALGERAVPHRPRLDVPRPARGMRAGAGRNWTRRLRHRRSLASASPERSAWK